MADKKRSEDPRKDLVGFGKDVVEQINKQKNPDVILPVRALSNIYFDEKSKIIQLGNKVSHRTYANIAHTKKFMQTMLVAAECKKILDQGVTTSIRDLYYALKRTIPETKENTFEEQSESVCPDETLLVRMGGELRLATGYEIIDFAEKNGKLIYDDGRKKRWKGLDLKVCAFGENNMIREMEAALVMKHPPNKVKRVTTSSGRSVKVTEHHSVFTCENGLPKPAEVGTLKKGDWVALPRSILVDVNNKEVNLIELLIRKLPDKDLKRLYLRGEKEDIGEILRRIGKVELKIFARQYKNVWSDVVANWKHWKSVPLSIVKYSGIDISDMASKLELGSKGSDSNFKLLVKKDNHLGAVFGFLISEGAHSIFTKRGREERFVSISNKSKALMEEFEGHLKAAFGEHSVSCNLLLSKDGVYIMNIGSNTLSHVLYALGYKPCRAWEKEVPPALLDAPRECVREFLRWFRLGDGSINLEKLRIRFHTTSKKLVNGLTFLLLREGAFPRIYTYIRSKPNHHTAYEVRVNTREYVERLSKITQDFKGIDLTRKSLVSGDRIPGIGQLIHEARKSCGKISSGAYKKVPWYEIENFQETISRGTLTKAIETLEPYANNANATAQLQNLGELAANDICWDQITSIEGAETPEFTLDIAVRPTQNFIGGDGLMILHNSDPILEDLEAALNTLREALNLKADRKGYLAGNLVIEDVGDTIDCTKMGSSGYGVPSNVEPNVVKFKKCTADFILVIEKDAVWQRLNEDKFWQKHNCIIITGKGQPDRGTRRIVNRLHNEFKLPVYVLTDADVWGYYIYSVIKQGSINLSFLSDRLGTPEAKFIGLTTQDVAAYDIPKNVTIKLNELDRKRAEEMLGYVWFKPKEWQHEIKHISEKYLPKKIATKDFLP